MRRIVGCMLKMVTIAYIASILILVLPSFLGIQVLAVTSGSMEPVIPVGAVVYAQPVDFSEVQEGDVIAFHLEKSNTKVTHRVVGKDEALKFVATKGDANKEPDAHPVSYQNIDGIVKCSIPHMGRLAVFLNTISGKIIGISVLILLLILEELTGQSGCKNSRPLKKGGEDHVILREKV